MIDEPDRGRRVNKQPRRTFTKEVHLFFGWPVSQPTSITFEFREAVCEEQPDVVVNLAGLNLVEDKDVCCLDQRRESETLLNAGLWAAGDKELDCGDLSNELPEDGQDCGSRLCVFAFIQGVNNDNGRNGGFR